MDFPCSADAEGKLYVIYYTTNKYSLFQVKDNGSQLWKCCIIGMQNKCIIMVQTLSLIHI